jgi:hypothetical protein
MGDTQEFVELVSGAEAHPRSKSMKHRMFFERGGRLIPVKGEYVPGSSLEDGKIRARLFTYHLEGPPFTLPQVAPHVADLQAERKPTRYEATAINAIHAREDVIASTAFRPTGYGPGFTLLCDELEEGCPEWEHGQALTQALAAYDAMVEACETYEEWEEKHGKFLGSFPTWQQALAASALNPEKDGSFTVASPEEFAASTAQRQALFKHFGGGSQNVEMNLRFRAGRSEHWQKIAQPALDAQAAEAEAEAQLLDARKATMDKISDKFRTLYEGMDEDELALLGGIFEKMGVATGEGPVTAEKIMDMSQAAGGLAQQQLSQFAPGSDWVELAPGAFPPPGALGAGAAHDFAKDFPDAFPGMAGPQFDPRMAYPAGVEGLGGLFTKQGFAQVPIGVPFVSPPAYGPGLPFAPGAGESFTLGDGQERDQRQIEALAGEADTLRARLHADANERKRKLGLAKDVAAGALHWLLEKLEGAPAPVPEEPVGPVEQIMGRTAVNGGRASVMHALQEQLFKTGREATAVPQVGAPGEEF